METKTKAFVFRRSRTVNPLHGDVVMSGICIRASPNLAILGVKSDSKQYLRRPCAWYCFLSLREIGLLRLINVYLWTPPCYFVAISNLYFQFLSIVFWYGRQLLNVTCFMFLRAMYIRWPLFILIRVYFRCIIDVMLLGLYVVQG